MKKPLEIKQKQSKRLSQNTKPLKERNQFRTLEDQGRAFRLGEQLAKELQKQK